jgi:histidinol-phosphatase (PHP family)
VEPSGADSFLADCADYHLHTPLCRHATGWPVDFAARACEVGLREIGFADHNPMAAPFDDWRMLREELPHYFQAIESARAQFPQVTIRLGLECDFLEGGQGWLEELATLAPWDYLIGSVHYLPEGWEVDHPRYLARHAGNAEEIWTSYWGTYERAIRSGLFDFMAHPELPKKFGHRPPGDLRRFYEPSIAALAEHDIAFELNTAGLRKACGEVYPSQTFLEMARAANVPILINSDAHAPEELAANFGEAIALARAAGYREVVRFSRRTKTRVALPP